jgi:protocatechuate 3,4-dioxygenase beta subunit
MRLRSAKRRRRYERRAGRPGAESSPSEILERFEIQRLVAKTVSELKEPYRTTILLRYFEDVSPAEIAERTGEAPGTVRSRLTRGLGLLRERLDAAHRGDRRACLLSLAAAAGLAEESAAMAGAATAIATKAKLAVAASLLVATGIVVWRTANDAANEATPDRATPRTASTVGADSPVFVDSPQPETAPPPDRAETVAVEGRILAPWDAGLADADVYLFEPCLGHPAKGPKLAGRARTGSDGGFVISTTATRRLFLVAKADGFEWNRKSILRRRRGLELALNPARQVAGLVVDEGGSPVPGAHVRWEGIPMSEVVASRDGAFQLESCREPGAEAWHPDFLPKRERIGPASSRIVLGRGEILEGVLLSHGERQPVAGAAVHVFANYEHIATTDGSGGFAVRHDLRERGRQYMIWVEAGRFGTLFVPRIPWTPGYPLELTLRLTRILTGRVLTANGRKPVGGAIVDITNTGAEADTLEGPPRKEAVSREDGSIRIEGLSTRQLRLGVRHPEHALANGPDATYVLAGGDQEIEVLVAPRLSVVGRVLGPDGQPLPDAAVCVDRAGNLSRLRPSQFQDAPGTDSRGRFQLRWPPHAYFPRLYRECELVAFHPDFEMASSDPFKPVPGSRHELEIQLATPRATLASGQITGRVEDQHGAPVPMAYLTAKGAQRHRSTHSAPDGTFRIRGLRDGAYSLRCMGSGFVHVTLDNVAVGSEVRIALHPGHDFRGRLVDEDGKPVRGARVGLRPWGQLGGYVRSRSDGSFEFKGEKPGQYHLRLAQGEAIEVDPREFSIPCEKVVEFVVRRLPPPVPNSEEPPRLLPIEGRVLRRDDKPFPLGTLVLVRAGRDGSHDRAETWCDLEGRFALQVPEGTYTLKVVLEGYERAIFELARNIATGTRDLVIRPVETGSIAGLVLGPDGRPVRHVTVTAVKHEDARPTDQPRPRGRGTSWPGAVGSSDDQGRFSIAYLVEGTYVLVAFHKDYALAYLPNRSWKESNVRIVLEAGNTLSGRVLGPDGEPLRLKDPATRIEVVDATGVRRHAYTDTDETFVVRGLADGECSVLATARARSLYWWREGVRTDSKDLVVQLEELSAEEFRARTSRARGR